MYVLYFPDFSKFLFLYNLSSALNASLPSFNKLAPILFYDNVPLYKLSSKNMLQI